MASNIGKWRSPVAHSAGGRAVAGSNPVFPTRSERRSNRAGNAYWTDFRLIRESRKITLEEVHAETRIPIGVLRDFESDGLKSHEQLNNVYRRSLISAYASAVGVDSDLARRSISSSADGAYDGTLARTYLSWSPRQVEKPDPQGETTETDPSSFRSRHLGRRSLTSLSSSRQAQFGSKIVGLVFLLVVVVVAVFLATGSP